MYTNKKKKVYKKPVVHSIKLDNDISLAMESDAPTGPNEVLNKTPEYQNNNPYKLKT